MKIKQILLATFLVLISFIAADKAQAQVSNSIDSNKVYVIIKNDGSEFIGKIISSDMREVVMETQKLGAIAIPKHEIKIMKLLQNGDLGTAGSFVPNEPFATRYFITTNGLPIAKGESYITYNLFGPDIQYGLADNLGVGVITSWIGSPIIFTTKYSFEIDKNVNGAVGLLAGTGGWASSFGLAIPYGSITLGNRKSNITGSLGYGTIWGNENNGGGRTIVSIAAMHKISKSISLVFDSFILPTTKTYIDPFDNKEYKNYFALLLPGFRFQTSETGAFQFGFAGMSFEGETFAVPFPYIQWFRKF
jgi:hypothetical protein